MLPEVFFLPVGSNNFVRGVGYSQPGDAEAYLGCCDVPLCALCGVPVEAGVRAPISLIGLQSRPIGFCFGRGGFGISSGFVFVVNPFSDVLHVVA